MYVIESIVLSNKVPNNTNAYGIVFIEKYLDTNQLVQIVNDSLKVKEQVQTIKLSEQSLKNIQEYYADIEDKSDTLSGISEEISTDCSIFFW